MTCRHEVHREERGGGRGLASADVKERVCGRHKMAVGNGIDMHARACERAGE